MRAATRTWRASASVVLVGVLAGCTSTRAVTSTARTAMQQLVVSEAVDRALRGLEWPSLPGQRVWVEAKGPAAPEDRLYLQGAVERELSVRGAAIVPERGSADIVAAALAGSLGTEQSSRFLGVPQMQSLLLPLPIPEIGLYKSSRQDGFAKIELTFFDSHDQRVLFHAGPAAGDAYWAEFSVLLFGFYRTDTSRDPGGFVDAFVGPAPTPDEQSPPQPPVIVAPPDA